MSENALDYGVEFSWKVHQSPLPELDTDGYDIDPPDALIIGAGPVGLAIAAGLATRGIRVVVLETDTVVCRSSRANGIAARAFETLDRLSPGTGTRLSRRSARSMGSTTYYGERVILEQESHTAAELGTKFEPSSYLSQWWIEDGLVDALDNLDNASIRWSSSATKIRQRADHVEVDVTTDKGDYSIRAPWVIAADGGRSTVRHLLGKRMTGVTYGPAFIVVDAKVGGTLPAHERSVWFDPPYLPGGLLLRHIPPDGFWRLDFQFPLGTDLEPYLSNEAVTDLVVAHLKDVGHDSLDVETYWYNVYEPRSLSLDTFREGRILFAGDAAHVLPFFGGFGFNAGLDDAGNLAWKLGQVIEGVSSERLLDSYSLERVPAVRASGDIVSLSAEYLTPTSKESERLRRGALTLAAQGDLLTAGLGRHRLSRPIALSESPVCRPDDPAFDAGPGPGTLVPTGWLDVDGERTWIHDALAPGFVWLVFPGAVTDGSLDDAARAVRGLGVSLSVIEVDAENPGATRYTDPDGTLREAFDAEPGAVYAIRPDRIVAARWRSTTAGQIAETTAAMLMRDVEEP